MDDGSADGTGDVAAQHGATVLRHPFNLGYGAALQTGYKYALERGAASSSCSSTPTASTTPPRSRASRRRSTPASSTS